MTRLEWVSVALPGIAAVAGLAVWGLGWREGAIIWWRVDGLLQVLAWLPTAGVALAVTDVIARTVRQRRRRTAQAPQLKVVGLAISLLAWWPATVVPTAPAYKIDSRRTQVALSNARILTTAAIKYASEHNRLPTAARWCDEIFPYLPYPRDRRTFRNPQAPTLKCAWAFNSALSGARHDLIMDSTPRDASRVVLIFDSDRGWSAAGGPELLPKASRSRRGDIYGFVDGHVQVLSRQDEASLRWLVWQPKLK